MRSTSDKDGLPAKPDLSHAWRELAESGEAASELEAPRDDPEGRWRSGDKILFGVVHTGRGLRYAAENLTAGKVINVRVEEKEIPGTGFRCQLNSFRSLRPRGDASTGGARQAIPPSPDECKFYCQDSTHPLSLLRRTPLARVRLKNHIWNAYRNVVPLEIEGHFMWIPAGAAGDGRALPHYPQALNRAIVEDIFLLRDVSRDFMLLFNSPRAGASVSHLHLHAVFRRHALAIEREPAVGRGGFQVLDEYPAAALVFQGAPSVEYVSEHVTGLQDRGVPFNLALIGGRAFLVPRHSGHELTEEFPHDPLSAIDMCGQIVTTDRATYDSVTKERIVAALRKSTRRDLLPT